MKLRCKACGAEVEQPSDRACGHNDSAVLADMSATVYGEGGAVAKSSNWLEDAIRKTIRFIKQNHN